MIGLSIEQIKNLGPGWPSLILQVADIILALLAIYVSIKLAKKSIKVIKKPNDEKLAELTKSFFKFLAKKGIIGPISKVTVGISFMILLFVLIICASLADLMKISFFFIVGCYILHILHDETKNAEAREYIGPNVSCTQVPLHTDSRISDMDGTDGRDRSGLQGPLDKERSAEIIPDT